jgi:uncharacterized membrane protein YfcA
MLLLLGALAVSLAAFLGGVVGFAYGLVALPLLLLLGVPLADVVVINLVVGLITRLVVVARRYADIDTSRAGLLMLGSLPGIGLGLVLREVVPVQPVKVGAGIVTLVAVAAIVWKQRHTALAPPTDSPRGLVLTAGGLGGFLGPTTSLNGMPPALLLTGSRATARTLVADLAAYFVVSNGLTLLALLVSGNGASSDVVPQLAAWLPAGLLANYVGITLGPRLPQLLFRRLTLVVIAVSGATSLVQTL